MEREINLKEINLDKFDYNLSEDRIAQKARTKRDESNLLVYNHGNIQHDIFYNIYKHIPFGSTLYLNNTKVIPARIHFQKPTGAIIEVFLTEPTSPSHDFIVTISAKKSVTWKTIIGNLKKWKDDETLVYNTPGLTLKARLLSREDFMVAFEWEENLTFSEVLDIIGKVPLPPYVKRDPVEEDKLRYQTVYSKFEGAVAAPTAGLHFTENVFEDLGKNKIKKRFLTLHVSSGTFKPIKSNSVVEHPMHNEYVSVTKETLEGLINDDFVIPVGTTSMRTLESIYWYGVRLIKEGSETPFFIPKLYPYQHVESTLPSYKESVNTILNRMLSDNLESINGATEIFIVPGYKFRICQGLITNFHMPKSTLILLIAAFIGNNWKEVYNEALKKGYKFLSYGDSSILIP